MGGSGSTRSEDIALARSQRLDVDDDNEPAPENIPAVGTAIDSMDKSGDGMVLVIKIRTSRGCEPSNQRLYQEWSWCHIKSWGVFPLELAFFERVAEVRDSPKFFKILRIEMENYPITMTMGIYWIEPPWI
jgi:hypothetical protein